jgi:peptidoglycan hydrolase-like protein with peptidoglycan-binding domain
MHTWVAVRLVSVLAVCPLMGEAGTTGQPPPEQPRIITTENLKLVQERLKAEGVYAGPVDGEMNAQTEAALRGRLVTQSTTSPKVTMTRHP